MTGVDFSKQPDRVLTDLVPVWLDREIEYANGKHGHNNPQRASLRGDLGRPASGAFQDFANYFGRLRQFYQYADGEEAILLNASRAAGKFMGVGRALARVLIESIEDKDMHQADARASEIVRQVSGSIAVNRSLIPESLTSFFTDAVEPSLITVDGHIADGDLEDALGVATDLFAEQAELFASFSGTTGIMAMPGTSSTDAAKHWVPEEDLLH